MNVSLPVAKASELAYLRLSRKDLEACEAFFHTFGLHTAKRTDTHLWLRAAGPAPFCLEIEKGEDAFLGAGLCVTKNELIALGDLPTAQSGTSPIIGPGGGEFVRFVMPCGFTLDAVAGRSPDAEISLRDPLPVNSGGTINRLNRGQRPDLSTANVLRLGHAVMEVVDFHANLDFIRRHFGLIPTDIQELADGTPVVAFNRLDCGDTPADHHALVIAQSFDNRFNHAAFECLDLDSVAAGNLLMKQAGYRHAWGIGRHILGSQIFDYWQDDTGAKFEHYTDGDMFDVNHPTEHHRLCGNAQHQWGPDMPKSFLDAGMSPRRLVKVIKNIRNSDELTFQKLMAIKKAAAE